MQLCKKRAVQSDLVPHEAGSLEAAPITSQSTSSNSEPCLPATNLRAATEWPPLPLKKPTPPEVVTIPFVSALPSMLLVVLSSEALLSLGFVKMRKAHRSGDTCRGGAPGHLAVVASTRCTANRHLRYRAASSCSNSVPCWVSDAEHFPHLGKPLTVARLVAL